MATQIFLVFTHPENWGRSMKPIQPPTRTSWVSNLMFGTILTIFQYTKIGSQTVPNMMHGWVSDGPGGEFAQFLSFHYLIWTTLFLHAQIESQKAYHHWRIFEGIIHVFFNSFLNHLKPIKLFEGRIYIDWFAWYTQINVYIATYTVHHCTRIKKPLI